jgi:hypothetical protein
MHKAALKLTYFSTARDLVLPEYSELQAHRQRQDEIVMILPATSGSAGYQGGKPCLWFSMVDVS